MCNICKICVIRNYLMRKAHKGRLDDFSNANFAETTKMLVRERASVADVRRSRGRNLNFRQFKVGP